MGNRVLDAWRKKYPDTKRLPDESLAKIIKLKHPGSYDRDLAEFFIDKGPAPKPKPLEWGQVPGKSAKNFPKSAGEFATGIVEAGLSPVETAKGMGNLLLNVLKSSSPDPRMQSEGRRALAPLFEHFKGKYESEDAFKETIAQDPVGFMADLSTVLSGTGAAVGGVGTAAGMSKVATAGKAIKTAGALTDPIAGPFEVGKVGIRATRLPEREYAKALKLPSNIIPSARKQIIETGLKYKVPVSSGGYEKLMTSIDGLNAEISTKIEAAAKAGKTVDVGEALKKLDDVDEFYSNDPQYGRIKVQLDRLRKEFSETHGQIIPIDKAQKIKQHTYKTVRSLYDPKSGKPIPEVAKKARAAYASGLREEIAKLEPDINLLNKEEWEKLGLAPYIEKMVSARERHTLSALSPLIIASGSPGLASGLITAREIFNAPYFRSRLALGLNAARKRSGRPSKVLKPIGMYEQATKEE